jgi:hypothetical protein
VTNRAVYCRAVADECKSRGKIAQDLPRIKLRNVFFRLFFKAQSVRERFVGGLRLSLHQFE